MTIGELAEILEAKILADHHDHDFEIPIGGAADLMSDVLAFGSDGMVLMTGLTNPQVVRTAEMAGISVIVFVRAKMPPPETVQLANDIGITLVTTGYTMYEACGRLYAAGLRGLGPVKIENGTW